MPPELPNYLAVLRKTLRAQRRNIPEATRLHASQCLAENLFALPLFAAAQFVAAYWAQDGEVETAPIFHQVWALQKQGFLPVLTGNKQRPMVFALYQADTLLKPNRFGIPEPQMPTDTAWSGQQLDLVLTPLVAFSENGSRLGMGGGFYDRTFAFRRDSAHDIKPYLLGLAFESQKVVELPNRPWDVPLDGVITERTLYQRPYEKAQTLT